MLKEPLAVIRAVGSRTIRRQLIIWLISWTTSALRMRKDISCTEPIEAPGSLTDWFEIPGA
jgi:hypothetical protein